ncbi:MAG: hypothetical protein ACO331_12290 [Prochlorothrix sp.]
MAIALYSEVVITQDLPEYQLASGTRAALLDYVPHPTDGEEGAILEVFNDFDTSIQVLTVPCSSIQPWSELDTQHQATPVPSTADRQVIEEALTILQQHMDPDKLQEFISACHLRGNFGVKAADLGRNREYSELG